MNIIDHYTKKEKEYRFLTLPEILQLKNHALITGNNGEVYRVKINGAVKTWKKSPRSFEVLPPEPQSSFGFVSSVVRRGQRDQFFSWPVGHGPWPAP